MKSYYSGKEGKGMKYTLFALALFFSNTSFAITVVSKVTSYRTFPEAQSVVAARNHVVFDVEAGLSENCDAVYLPPTSVPSISMVLAAKMANVPIKLVYTETPSPWHARTCTVVEVSLN